jgi:hypothetical protein
MLEDEPEEQPLQSNNLYNLDKEIKFTRGLLKGQKKREAKAKGKTMNFKAEQLQSSVSTAASTATTAETSQDS